MNNKFLTRASINMNPYYIGQMHLSLRNHWSVNLIFKHEKAWQLLWKQLNISPKLYTTSDSY